jgi:SpoVK/Ycf46/Vps4 family AAA+-type ATPase
MIAKIWKQPLLRLDASRLFSKYIGDSERNFQNAMDIAEAMAPSVFWIDEIEKLFGAAGATSSGSDGGLAQRLFGSLLTWLQEKNLGVFLVATANNLDLLPPELLRKGRFDEIFFVDLPTEKERQEILSVQLSHRKQDQKQFDLAALASATKGYSGAELEQIIISALLKTLARKSQLKDSDIIAEAQSFTPLAIARAQDIADMRTYALAHFTPAS